MSLLFFCRKLRIQHRSPPHIAPRCRQAFGRLQRTVLYHERGVGPSLPGRCASNAAKSSGAIWMDRRQMTWMGSVLSLKECWALSINDDRCMRKWQHHWRAVRHDRHCQMLFEQWKAQELYGVFWAINHSTSITGHDIAKYSWSILRSLHPVHSSKGAGKGYPFITKLNSDTNTISSLLIVMVMENDDQSPTTRSCSWYGVTVSCAMATHWRKVSCALWWGKHN